MSKGKHDSQIKMIAIDRINILNPRVRNQKIFYDVATNIAKVGLKRPITVTPCTSNVPDKEYDLVCGQGRLESFMACGQKMIPAIVIDASEEQALIMSLVENLARRQHSSMDLLQGIEALKNQGYDTKTIGAKIGLTPSYVNEVLSLMERGEERLLKSVEYGHMPIRVAMMIAESPGNAQAALQEAYETKQLRGKKFLLAKQLISTRDRHGKAILKRYRKPGGSDSERVNARDVVKVYQQEVSRKRILSRKADIVNDKLTIIIAALRQLLKEENYTNLLRAEKMDILPKPLVLMLERRGVTCG